MDFFLRNLEPVQLYALAVVLGYCYSSNRRLRALERKTDRLVTEVYMLLETHHLKGDRENGSLPIRSS
jgi:hypothetical protein